MRNLILPVAVFFLSAGAFADGKLAFKNCHTGDKALSALAAKAAEASEKSGKINSKDYEEIWYSSCSEKHAMEYAQLAKQGKLDVKAFSAVAGKSCTGNSRLGLAGAGEVAKAAAEKALEVKTFLKMWDEACDFNPAYEGAKAAKAGILDEKAFHDYYSVAFKQCLGISRPRGDQAQKMATGIKNGSIKREAFLQMWSKACKFDSALAAGQRKLTRSPAFLAPIADDETESGAEEAK